ncbi:hypothetical protein [Salmonella phage Tennessee]|uniref:Uncharacterized protein n=5 Tax=Tequintavirus TaxID=187218 RepID=A0AAE8B0C4_9CAUD|nr:hypothetical protein HOS34_gp021 [Shigella phage SSP1]QXV77291.1 hypothetical protein bas31_0088 [Escherichia phage DaisyDussoix]QXV80098.1 hypothetical protein bas33_0090 [Escherichia phage HildyBeyeler]QXV80267.1 hypothetical protein bas32_0089 [Escherichia phage IrisVonRoten]UIS65967.1 hypothetical protein [Escherichia phage PNJ1902]UYL23129.1 hypothetical protein [Salmonella phage PS3-1]WNL62741.1 hypothetical protein [Escherichia phage Es2]
MKLKDYYIGWFVGLVVGFSLGYNMYQLIN